jgi:hypothetical protein
MASLANGALASSSNVELGSRLAQAGAMAVSHLPAALLPPHERGEGCRASDQELINKLCVLD